MATPQRKVPAVVVLFLWLAGLMGGACAAAGLLLSGIVPVAVINSVPLLGLIVICAGGAGGAVLSGLLISSLEAGSASGNTSQPDEK